MTYRTEYAGFRYVITEIQDELTIAPEPGQHSAASKEKHMRAALDEWKHYNRRKA